MSLAPGGPHSLGFYSGASPEVRAMYMPSSPCPWPLQCRTDLDLNPDFATKLYKTLGPLNYSKLLFVHLYVQ